MDRGEVGWLNQESEGRPGSDGVFPIDPPGYYNEADAAEYRNRIQRGLAVSTFYYPCAD